MKEAIYIKYIYSSCIITKTPDISILHDPWFTEGIYDGSWYQFPKVQNPIKSIGNVDCIFISHIHPDHYDSNFLIEYFKFYGIKKVLIADHLPNHLAGKMKSDGIEPTILKDKIVLGKTSIEIIPHKTGSISDIDSSIIIKYQSTNNKSHCIVNCNDIFYDEQFFLKVKNVSKEVDILLCGFTGAGPYPQTYFDSFDPQIRIEADNKKLAFFEQYKNIINLIDAKVNIPFAGKYILGGKLSHLNEFRGVSDPVEVLNFDPKAIVLSDNGGEIDTDRLLPNSTRSIPYDLNKIKNRINEIKNSQMDYERLFNLNFLHKFPIERLLFIASQKAIIKSECNEDYFFCIHLPKEKVAIINANKNTSKNIYFENNNNTLPFPRSEIFIDTRYLFGLLTHIYHWNNAEVGSLFETRRFPNVFNRKAQSFLNYLSV
jgi:UDP-MurNAc hydroxylase